MWGEGRQKHHLLRVCCLRCSCSSRSRSFLERRYRSSSFRYQTGGQRCRSKCAWFSAGARHRRVRARHGTVPIPTAFLPSTVPPHRTWRHELHLPGEAAADAVVVGADVVQAPGGQLPGVVELRAETGLSRARWGHEMPQAVAHTPSPAAPAPPPPAPWGFASPPSQAAGLTPRQPLCVPASSPGR